MVLVGYAAGASYARVEKTLGRGSALAVLGVALIALLLWRVRPRRTERATTSHQGLSAGSVGGPEQG